MASVFLDLRIDGAKELDAQLAKLEVSVQRRVMGRALTKSRTRVKRHILRTIKGDIFAHPTGDLARIWKATKLFTKRRRGLILRGIRVVDADDSIKVNAIEYGHTTPGGGFIQPKSFVRSTVNRVEAEELRGIGDDIERGIDKLVAGVRN